MRYILLFSLLFSLFTLKGQTFSTEVLGMRSGVSALLSFSTPLFKSEKISFSEIGRFGIDYDGDNKMVFMMSNLGYAWSPHFQSTAGALYLGGKNIVPTLGLQAISVKEKRLFLVYPIVTVQSNPQLWLISAAEFNKMLKNERKGVFGISALQLFAEGEHAVTVGILHLGVQKGRFQYGFSSYLMFFGNHFDFQYDPGIYLKYQFL